MRHHDHRGPRRGPEDSPQAVPGGKRKAVKPSRRTRTLGRSGQTPSGRRLMLPSAPTVVGAVVLAVAATGAVNVPQPAEELAAATSTPAKVYTPAHVLTGVSADTSNRTLAERRQAVSRDSQRAALEDASGDDLQQAVEAQAQQRNAALAELAASAERYAGEIARNQWQLPLSNYSLSAEFGASSGLWASTHTGLDFAAPSGTPVGSVANGTVTSTEYAGSYGNRVIVTHEDGTETWYCHLTSFSVSPGESVTAGQQIGTVGSTGNSTGPHLHLEVRPGAGDPVDPYAALVAHGLNP